MSARTSIHDNAVVEFWCMNCDHSVKIPYFGRVPRYNTMPERSIFESTHFFWKLWRWVFCSNDMRCQDSDIVVSLMPRER